MDPRCPFCRKSVSEGASDCPACGKNLVRICSCGAQVSLVEGRCSTCGRSARPRRKKRFRLRLSRRSAAILVLVLVVGGVVAWLATRPDDDERLNDLYRRAGEAVAEKSYRLAKNLYGAYLEERPGDARALYLLGVSHFGLGEEKEGLAAVLKALDMKPNLTGARLFLARYYAGRDRLREAVEHAAASSETEGAVLHARLLVRLGRYEDASRAYGDALVRGGEDLGVLHEALEVERRLAAGSYGAAAAHQERVHTLLVKLRREAERRVAANPSDPESLFALARAVTEAGLDKPEDVEEIWRRALAADRTHAEVRAGLADFLAGLGRRDEAVKLLEEGASLSETPAGMLLLADFLAEGGERDRAVAVVREAVEKWPEDPALRAALVSALGTAGRTEDARRELEAAVAAHPEHVGLLQAGGDVMLALGDAAAADDYYRRALEIAPRNLELLRRRLRPRIDRLVAARSSGGDLPGDLTETAGMLDALRELNPWDRDGLIWEAQIARARGRQDVALSLLDQLLRYHPDDLAGRALRGELLFGRGAMEDAALELRRVVESSDSTPSDFALFVGAAYSFGRHAEVIEACEKGIERWPEEVGLYEALGRSSLALRRTARFVRRIEAAPESVRKSAAVRRVYAWCLAEEGRGVEAEQQFRLALADDPSARGEYARLLLRLGRVSEAEEFLRDTLAENPESTSARADLGEFLLAKGDREGALKLYSEAVDRDPEDVETVVRFGEIFLAGPLTEDVSSHLARVRAALARAPGGAPALLYIEGLDRLRARDGKGAEDRLGRYVRLRPARFEGHFHLATAYVLTNQVEEAVAELRTALAIRPGHRETLDRLATLTLDAAFERLGGRDFGVARDLFAKTVATGVAGQGGRVLLGLTAMLSGDLDATEEQVRVLLDEDPDDGAAWLLRALLCGPQGKAEEALAALDRVVSAAPDVPVVRAWRGFARLDAENPTGALDDFRAAERAGLSGPGLAWGSAHALQMLGREAKALELARRAAETWPEEARAHRAVGEILAAQGQSEAAAESLLKAYDLDSADVGPLVAAASLLIRAGRLDAAGAALDRAKEPRGIVLRIRGDLLRARGQAARAEDLYRRAAPDDPGAWAVLAEIEQARGDFAAALKDLEAAVKAGVTDPAVRFRYGVLLAQAGRTKEARKEFEGVLRERPDHPATLNNLASILSGPGGDLERAETYARRARQLRPEDAAIADTLGWILFLRDRAGEGIPFLVQAARDRPGSAETSYHLGMAFAKEGRKKDAEEALARALKAAPTAPWSATAVEELKKVRQR